MGVFGDLNKKIGENIVLLIKIQILNFFVGFFEIAKSLHGGTNDDALGF